MTGSGSYDDASLLVCQIDSTRLTFLAPVDNPVGGRDGQRNGRCGRFETYVPPLLEALGLVELEHHARDNRVRAL